MRADVSAPVAEEARLSADPIAENGVPDGYASRRVAPGGEAA
jgi:hypothetical protein